MRPPICDLCFTRFGMKTAGGGLVQFRLTPEDTAFNERFKQQGMVGHKKGLNWFCPDHFELAESFKHLHAIDAIRLMRETLR